MSIVHHRLQLPVRIQLRFLVLALAALSIPNCAFGQTQQPGFTVDYLDSWPVAADMKYIRAVIKPLNGTAKRDTDFYVVASYDDYSSGFTTSTRISIKKGDTKAIGELYVPTAHGYRFSIHTETDDNKKYDRRDFARRSYNEYGQQYAYSNMATPSLLFASSKVIADQSNQFMISPKTSKIAQNFTGLGVTTDYLQLDDLESAYADAVSFGGGRGYINLKGFTSPLIGHTSLEALPSRWFAYEGIGLLVITVDDLKLLSSQHPGKLLEIERWVAASGRLLVLNCGKNLEESASVLKFLGDKPLGEGPAKRTLYLKRPYKTTELVKNESAQYRNTNRPVLVGSFNPNNAAQDDAAMPKNSRSAIGTGNLRDVLSGNKAAGMIACDFKEGQVICLSDAYSFWGKEKKDINIWSAVQTFASNTERPEVDNRVLRTSTPFRSFGFPEFDEPPRYLFESSILLYLLAVGPVTFFILKRRHLLNLMFVVVPIISAIFCTSILAYAIFAEGFDTRVNLFTISQLDQSSGRITTSSISHIYSGVTPSNYRFEGSTYGLVNFPQDRRSQQLRWDPGSESISEGEIRARTNHQLFSRSSTKTESRLLISVGNKGTSEESTAVKNTFATPVIAVAYKTSSCAKNEVWICEGIPSGELKRGIKTTLTDAARKIQTAIRDRGAATVLASKATRTTELLV